MNPQSSESPGLNLPPPLVEQAPSTPSTKETIPSGPAIPERALPRGQSNPAGTQPAMPAPIALPPAPAAAPHNLRATAVAGTVPVAADDSDLIEKAWVSKAKEIVERTRENPYQQSKELNLFKADYMKKRYNKTLKLSE
jgi:hypothetical protein